jgi:hypothetical protein
MLTFLHFFPFFVPRFLFSSFPLRSVLLWPTKTMPRDVISRGRKGRRKEKAKESLVLLLLRRHAALSAT